MTITWEQRELINLIAKGDSGGTPLTSNPNYYNGKIPFLSITDVTNSNGYIFDTAKHISEEGLNSSSAWIVPKESISLAMYASVGKVAILKDNISTSQAFYNMTFNSLILRDFVFHTLQKYEISSFWDAKVSTGTQANLNADKVKKTAICIPKNNEECKSISTFLYALDNLITCHQRN